MRILIWSQYFWPENFRINEIVQQLSLQGNALTVLTSKPNYPEGAIYPGYKAWGIDRESYSDAEVIRIPIIPRRKGSKLDLILNYLSFILSGYIFAPFALKNRKYSVVFVYAPSPLLQALPAIFIAWLKGAKLVIWVQDLWPDALEATGFVKNKWVLKAAGVVVKFIYKHADSILIPSEAFRPSIEPFVSDKNSIIYLPNPADDLTVMKETTPKATKIAQDISKYFSLIYAGNIGHAQSVETIIQAANLLISYPEIKFYLVGSGNRAKTISTMIEDQKLENVVMVGQFPYSDMGAIFAVSSGLILSLKNYDSLSKTIPSKLQSYLSAGKPIIGSLNGEGKRLISEIRTGFSSPAEDPKSLADQVLKLYTLKPQEREKMGKNGREHYECFYSVPIITKCLEKYLKFKDPTL